MYENIMDTIGFVKNADPEVGSAMELELARQRRNLELIASENIVSPAVMAAMGSVLTNKYAEGYPGKRYYGGCEDVDIVENIAIERAKELFGAKYANVQPHSGAQANTAVYVALLQPGDTVMGMSLAHGGHLTHGSPVNISGKYFNFTSYGVNDEGYIDYEELYKTANKCKPKLIVAGASAYPRKIDFEKLASIARAVGAYLMVDMAHIAGLVAAGQHQSPVPYADIVTTTTHKTLRGPRGGLILTNNEYLAKKINSAIFPGTQGGPLMHVIAGKAVCFGAEDTKGREMDKEAYAMLKKAPINFYGNLEARDIPLGVCQVAVSDGFTGNVALKLYEGMGSYFAHTLKGMFMSSLGSKIAYLLMKKQVAAFRKKMDYSEVGGAVLMGISKPVIKAHGSSDANAFYNAVRQAKNCVEGDVIGEISRSIEKLKTDSAE